ncbi:MAG TPA: CaiB/BaiF CoA-transferase family protein [Chthoniobacterales bacterium]|nr:CaiB/BaiF CoA-transferase family protein [Chthoniobacterales bacterium]
MLEGLRVLSFCHYLQGPAGSQYLADLGADVIKIEPLSGAHERHWSGAKSFVGDVSSFYLCGNRNKRSLAINLKDKRAGAIIERLVAQTHAVIENFRPGVMDRLGFGYEELKKVNAKLIYASATGFGDSGPLADRPGQDLLIQSRCGLVASSGGTSSGATAVGAAVVDQHGGALLALGVLAAYVRLLRDGVGTRVESSLLNAGIDLQVEAITAYFAARADRSIYSRNANLATWFHDAPYGIYRTQDRLVAISVNSFQLLGEVLQSQELLHLQSSGRDPFYERDQYAEVLAKEVGKWKYAELVEEFDRRGIWWSPVQDYSELENDPQVLYNEIFTHVIINGTPVKMIKHPVAYDKTTPGIRYLALAPGQDSRAVLAEAGFAPSEIRDFEQEGLIRCGVNVNGEDVHVS